MTDELEVFKPPPAGIRIDIEGTVLLEEKELIIEGKSNLPEDAIMSAGLLEYSLADNYGRVINLQGDTGEKYVAESTGVTDEKGNFNITIKRPDPDRYYRLDVIFNPAIQKSKVQEIYGIWGEEIALNLGYTDFKYKENTVSGMILNAPIVKTTDAYGTDYKWNLAVPFGEKSRAIK